MNLTYLKYFYDTATLGNMSAAARENFVSQSAVSQGISKLEIALKTKLTTHQRQMFKLTEEGEVVFGEAKKLFSSLAEIQHKLNEMKGVLSGEIRFVCTNSLAQYFLPLPYLEMKDRYPHVKLHFHRGSLNFIHESLRSGKADFAIVLDGPEFDIYDKHIVAKGCFRVYGGAEEEGIIVDHVENGEVVELAVRYKERYGKEMVIKDAVSSWALVLTFLQMGKGAGYLPEFVGNGLEEVKWDIAPIQYSICVIMRKGSCITRAQREFIKLLQEPPQQ